MIRGGQDDFTCFQKSFWGGIRRGDFTFWDGNYCKGLCFWVAWEGEVWLFFKVGRLGVFFFSKKYFFGGVGWGGKILS